MNREDKKVKGEERKIGELMGEKLKRGVLLGTTRERNSTPSPTWKFGLIQPDGTLIQHPINTLSARKLGANLWETHSLGVEKMSKNGPSLSHHHKQDHVPEAQSQSPSKQPTSSNRSRKKLETSSALRNLRVEKIGQAQQPLSSASYCSSMEMSPYRPAISPNSSLFSKGKFGESSHGLKTSTELLKVLNRIWSLEEKHALDMSLVKTLKNELGQSQAQIQELLQEKQRDQNEIDNLTNQITELKVARKKDKGRIKELVEEKLENETKSRRHLEKHHHKELSEMKLSFSNALRELEREKKARTLLEDLCDEFAKGIRDYELEVRFLKQKPCEDPPIARGEGNDRFILHISEAWLDERAQMKLADTRDISQKQSHLDKLCLEIEAFFREKQSVNKPYESIHSLDTLRLNEPASAPWKANEGDESVNIISYQSLKQGHIGNYDGHVNRTAKSKKAKSRTQDVHETSSLRMPRKGDNSITDANIDLQDSTRNSSFNFLEGSFDPALFTGPSSPVKKWVSKVSSAADPESSSSRWPKGIKANTLREKLVEARIERARASKSSSRVD